MQLFIGHFVFFILLYQFNIDHSTFFLKNGLAHHISHVAFFWGAARSSDGGDVVADGASPEASQSISCHLAVLFILSLADGWLAGKLYELDLSCFLRVQLAIWCALVLLCTSIYSMGLEVAKTRLDAFYSRCA